MSRWVVRMLGIALLLVFVLRFTRLYQQLSKLQQSRETPVTSTR